MNKAFKDAFDKVKPETDKMLEGFVTGKCMTCGDTGKVPRNGTVCEDYWYGKTKPCPDC